MNYAGNRAALAFLFTDCGLAMTFLYVADTTAIPETARRNRASARKAYDTIAHYLPQLVLTAAESQSIEKQLSALRIRLEAAGEHFPF